VLLLIDRSDLLPIGVGYVVNLEGDNLLRTVERAVGHTWLSATIIALFGGYFITFIYDSPFKDVNFLPKGVALWFSAPKALRQFDQSGMVIPVVGVNAQQLLDYSFTGSEGGSCWHLCPRNTFNTMKV